MRFAVCLAAALVVHYKCISLANEPDTSRSAAGIEQAASHAFFECLSKLSFQYRSEVGKAVMKADRIEILLLDIKSLKEQLEEDDPSAPGREGDETQVFALSDSSTPLKIVQHRVLTPNSPLKNPPIAP